MQDSALVWDTVSENHIVRGDAIGGYNQECILV